MPKSIATAWRRSPQWITSRKPAIAPRNSPAMAASGVTAWPALTLKVPSPDRPGIENAECDQQSERRANNRTP